MTLSAAAIAEAAATGYSDFGSETTAYRDYRGVWVVGAWQWLPKYQFGIITEVDYAEAYAPEFQLRMILWTLIGLLAIALCGVFAYYSLAERIWRKLRKAESKPENLRQYELLERVGRGNGEVYRAKHALLQRDTAVKLLRGSRSDSNAINRFKREVQATSKLSNPHTIQILDYGHNSDGTFFYAVEFLDGLNLTDLVERFGPIGDGRAKYLLLQICESLQEAHREGMIHRDIQAFKCHAYSSRRPKRLSEGARLWFGASCSREGRCNTYHVG